VILRMNDAKCKERIEILNIRIFYQFAPTLTSTNAFPSYIHLAKFMD
jgi:hypothetical protein